MSDQENHNQNEEEYEEENMMNNQEDEEGQDVYAFDIQINDDSYLLVIGKTEENKILLRLIDKEDQTKPFFQNEFSLDDLRNINPIFNNIDEEDIAFQYLASNLNDAEKEIKIIDESQIKFIINITDEEEKIEIDFLLFKSIEEAGNENENEVANDNENENEEDIMEEAVEIITDEVNNDNEVNNNLHFKKKEEENLPPKTVNKNQEKEIKNESENVVSKKDNLEMNNQNIKPKEEKEVKANIDNNVINSMKEELLNVINNMNETFENKIMVQNEAFNKIKEDLIK